MAMAGLYDDVGNAVKAGRRIVIGVISIAITVAVGYFVVDSLNNSSNGTLGDVVAMVQTALAPIEGGLSFLGLLFIVVVAALVIQVISKIGEE